MSLDPKKFLDPPAQFRPAAFWSWNDLLDPHELQRQIREMKKAGWGGFFMHSREGLLTEYLGEEWFAAVGASIEEARKQGLGAWLYDEDKWPSGYAGGRVPLRGAEFREKCLICRKAGEPVEPNMELIAEEGERRFFQYTVPLGDARLNGMSFVDMLDPRVVAAFIEESYEPYAKRFGKDFGGVVPGVFTDEPPGLQRSGLPAGAVHWTPRLPQVFREQWGYDLLPQLASLFADTGEFQKVRHQFYRTVTTLFVESFAKRIGAWCEQRKLTFTGHYMGEDSLRAQMDWNPCIMPSNEWMTQPGIDHLSRNILHPHTPKQASSVANQLGKARCLSEMYGCTGQALSFEDRKWIADWHAALGINFVCQHLAAYSLKGSRKRDYPPTLSWQQPWWPDNALVDDYVARLSWALTQGRPIIELLVLHPQESAFCLYTPAAGKLENDPLAPLQRDFSALQENLLRLHRDYDLGDETIVARHGDVRDSLFVVRDSSYRVVLLSSLVTIRKSTAELLLKFISAGGAVFACGQLPRLIDGAADPLAEQLARAVTHVENKADCLRVALERVVPAEFEPRALLCPDYLLTHRRKLDDGSQLYFLANPSRTFTFGGVLSFPRGGVVAERWDLETGRVEPLPSPVPLDLPPAGSALIRVRPGTPAVAAQSVGCRQTFTLQPLWDLQRLDPNALTLDFCRFKRAGDDAFSEQFPVIGMKETLDRARYNGAVALQFEFENRMNTGGKVLMLAVEEAAQWRITVNGFPVQHDARLGWWRDISFQLMDIASAAKPGRNVIEMQRIFAAAEPASGETARRLGTELESVYLVGNFCVRATRSARALPANPQHKAWDLPGIWVGRFAPGFALVDDVNQVLARLYAPPQNTDRIVDGIASVKAGEGEVEACDLTAQGFPFYAGRMVFSQAVTLRKPQAGERFFLELSRLDATVARVRLNGNACGAIWHQPYRAELTPHVCDGQNFLEIELAGSLRNVLGPHHHAFGELVSVGPGDFSGGGFSWSSGAGERDWLEKRRGGESKRWTDDYFLLPFGLLGEVSIRVYR